MAGAKEIRGKIKSVKNTQKITRAMEMVATSRMRRVQERMFTSRPYAAKILKVIGHLATAHPEYRHPFLTPRTPQRAGFIVVTTDRGLCGGLNVNLLRTTIAAIADWKQKGVDVDMGVIGQKGGAFFKRFGGQVVAQIERLGYTPRITDFIGIVKVMLDAYTEGKIDTLFITYNRFVNTMTQKPQVQQLLPLPVVSHTNEKPQPYYWDYIYEPDARVLLDKLLERYIESQVYQAVVENIACEQAARRVAMKSASDNAGELIDKLQLVYNKARQAGITKELAEIVGGAAAV